MGCNACLNYSKDLHHVYNVDVHVYTFYGRFDGDVTALRFVNSHKQTDAGSTIHPLGARSVGAMDVDENPQTASSHLMPHHSVSSRVSRRESKRRSIGATSTSSGPIDSFTTMMRRMSSTGSTHGPHPPSSPGYYTMGMSIPTSGLITSLPGAAHFSGGTSVRSTIHYVSSTLV